MSMANINSSVAGTEYRGGRFPAWKRNSPMWGRCPTEVFKAEVNAWAKRIGVDPKEVHLRPMRRKWASCSSKGRLTFNTELLGETASFRREVIVHELLHLKIPNHGKVFRSLLRAYLSNP